MQNDLRDNPHLVYKNDSEKPLISKVKIKTIVKLWPWETKKMAFLKAMADIYETGDWLGKVNVGKLGKYGPV